jgi:hypothetical protein
MRLFLWVIIIMNMISSGTIFVYNSTYNLQCQTIFRHSFYLNLVLDHFISFFLCCKKQNSLCGEDIHPSIYLFSHPPNWPCVSDWLVCQICVKLGIRVLYKKLLSRCEFCENQHRKSHVVCKGINEYLSIVSIFLDQFQ